VNFISRSHAYYYFNLGNYLAWKPYFLPEDGVLTDLDKEWISWINSINSDPSQEFKFNRDDFETGSRTRTYSSGTLRIAVSAVRELDYRNINFTVTYSNEATTLLAVSPTAAAFQINV
jgi:hypothetical protein